MAKFSIAGYLLDNVGKKSSTRLITVVGGGLFLLSVCFVWTYVSIEKNELMDIPTGVSWFVGTLLGLKTLQAGIEGAKQVLAGRKQNGGSPDPTTAAGSPTEGLTGA